MKLYYAPGACSLAPHIVLNEIGAEYSLEKVDLALKKTENGANYTDVNGKGYVPTLEFAKDQVLTEVSTILQYLTDKAEGSKLLPKFGSMERYRAMEALNFVAAELHKGLGVLFAKGIPDDARKILIERVSKRLNWLDQQLGIKQYLLGADYSVADAYAFTVLNWGQWVGVDMKQWPNISAFIERVAQRPAVMAAMKKEGLLAG
jgi:glutathione S-transferase